VSSTQRPKEILDQTDPLVREIIAEILTIEKEYLHLKNLDAVKEKEREVCDRIIAVIDKKVGK
jgi:hypothetical protein